MLAPANRRLSEDLCTLLAGNDLFILAEAVRSLTSAMSLGNDICGPPHCTDKRPHASLGFMARAEEEEEEEEEAQPRGLSPVLQEAAGVHSGSFRADETHLLTLF